MRTITVGFSQSYKIGSKLIRLCTKSKISHCYLRIDYPKYVTTVVYHASGISVNFENYTHFLTHSNVVDEITIQVSEDDFETGVKFQLQEVGKPYAIRQLLGYSFVLIGKIFNMKIKNPLANGTKSYVCSELVMKFLNMEESENLTPDELYQIIKMKYKVNS